MNLIFLVLSMYYGMKLLGGFCQVNTLTYTRDKFIAMLEELGETDAGDIYRRIQTKELNEDLSITFLGTSGGGMTLANGLDVAMFSNEKTYPAVVERAKTIKLSDALDIMMPDFYRVVVAGPDREADLLAVTSDEIIKILGIDDIVKPTVILGDV